MEDDCAEMRTVGLRVGDTEVFNAIFSDISSVEK